MWTLDTLVHTGRVREPARSGALATASTSVGPQPGAGADAAAEEGRVASCRQPARRGLSAATASAADANSESRGRRHNHKQPGRESATQGPIPSQNVLS